MKHIKNLSAAGRLLMFAALVLAGLTAYSQPVTHAQTDTIFCMPLWRAERVTEDALLLAKADSMVDNRNGRIIDLKTELNDKISDFERLLTNSASQNLEQLEIIERLTKQVASYKGQLKVSGKRTLWLQIKFYAAVTALAVVTWLAIK